MGYSVDELSGERKPYHPLTVEFTVCREMRWDRATFRRQSPSFIYSILAHASAESDAWRAKQQSAEAKRVAHR